MTTNAAMPRDDFGRTTLVTMLDRAHSALPAHDLAAVLLGMRRMLSPMATGARAAATEPAPSLSRAAAGHLRPLEWELDLARLYDDPSLPRLCDELDHYLDELAARPSGCAIA
jgi:hypothetical protein